MHQICYLLAQVQKPGTDQGQVNLPTPSVCMPPWVAWGFAEAWAQHQQICCHIRPGRKPAVAAVHPVVSVCGLRGGRIDHRGPSLGSQASQCPTSGGRALADGGLCLWRRSCSSWTSARATKISTITWRSSSPRGTACPSRCAGGCLLRSPAAPPSMLASLSKLDAHTICSACTCYGVALGCLQLVVSWEAQVRQSAGLLLKNNLKDHYAATTEEFRKYIKVRAHWRLCTRACLAPPARHPQPQQAAAARGGHQRGGDRGRGRPADMAGAADEPGAVPGEQRPQCARGRARRPVQGVLAPKPGSSAALRPRMPGRPHSCCCRQQQLPPVGCTLRSGRATFGSAQCGRAQAGCACVWRQPRGKKPECSGAQAGCACVWRQQRGRADVLHSSTHLHGSGVAASGDAQ